MRHRVSGRKLSRPTGHRMLMLRTMVTDLIRHESIRTTEAKAREVRRMAEKVITHGKKSTLHNRRQALTVLTDERVVRKVFDELGARYESRSGGVHDPGQARAAKGRCGAHGDRRAVALNRPYHAQCDWH